MAVRHAAEREVVRLVAQERVQWIDEQRWRCQFHKITEEIGKEIVDLPAPPVDATEALSVSSLCDFTRASEEVLQHVFRQGSGLD